MAIKKGEAQAESLLRRGRSMKHLEPLGSPAEFPRHFNLDLWISFGSLKTKSSFEMIRTWFYKRY